LYRTVNTLHPNYKDWSLTMTPYHITPHHTRSHHITPHHTTSHHITLQKVYIYPKLLS